MAATWVQNEVVHCYKCNSDCAALFRVNDGKSQTNIRCVSKLGVNRFQKDDDDTTEDIRTKLNHMKIG